MNGQFAAELGCLVEEIDTPALIVDHDALSRNIARMAEACRRIGVNLRPHAKAHKSPDIARLQMRAGAIGQCCQKTGEAEALHAAGVGPLLISSEVVGATKLARVAAIADSELIVVVDGIEPAAALSDALVRAGRTAGVLVDVNIGQDRCGTSPGAPAAELAAAVSTLKGLRLRGIQAYQGRIQHVSGYAQRCAAAKAASEKLEATLESFRLNGLSTEIVSGGGTGTYAFDGGAGFYTEIQPGSYIFMDAHYRSIGGANGDVYDDFAPALSVMAAVISVPAADRVILDAGLKALSSDSGVPQPIGLSGWNFSFAGDEHGTLSRTGDGPPLKLGDRVRLMPSHCDTTVNLYDEYHVVRDGKVSAIWGIPGRGKTR